MTGSGSGKLLDYVTAHSPRRLLSEVVLLIAQTAAVGVMNGEQAEWTMTVERSAENDGGHPSSVGFRVFDGFYFKPGWWTAGSVPAGLAEPLVERAATTVRGIIEERCLLDEIRTLVIQLYVALYPSGLVGPDFDYGTHRPGRKISIERVSCADRLQQKNIWFGLVVRDSPTEALPGHARRSR